MDVVPNAASSSSSSLSTQREKSSIPLAAPDSLPKHQEGAAEEVWVYPSEQQFFNAMKRKVGTKHTHQWVMAALGFVCGACVKGISRHA